MNGYKLAIGRDDSYASWKTHPGAHKAVYNGLHDLLVQHFEMGKKPDIIVCHGSSSVFACVPLIHLLAGYGIKLFHLRKQDEVCHGEEFEGPRIERTADEGPFEAWFIDDCCASGDTVRRVQSAMRRYNTNLTCAILYASRWGGVVTGVRMIHRNFIEGIITPQ